MLPLRKELFWDVYFDRLTVETHQRLIIERVLSLGNLNEFYFILETYSPQTIIRVLSQAGYLDPKTMSFVVSYFHIPKTKLKCYTRKPSATIPWD
jgi:hypothetical protein